MKLWGIYERRDGTIMRQYIKKLSKAECDDRSVIMTLLKNYREKCLGPGYYLMDWYLTY